jgi:HSP20 family protein
MDTRDFDIEVFGDTLVVRGEKRFEREDTEGRWRVLQCAYGAFQRQVPLPVPVKGDEARATYRNGVLRIELPKQQPSKPRVVQIRVA